MSAARLPDKIEPDDVDEVCRRLTAGQVLLLPTDTIYGLCCGYLHQRAVDRIFEIKARGTDVPLSVLVSGRKQAERLVVADERLAAMDSGGWPPGLTAVMPRSAFGHKVRGVGSDKVGIRRPNGGLIGKVVAAVGPVAATSANTHGNAPATSVDAILDDLMSRTTGEAVDGFVDGGTIDSMPSTVVDVLPEGWRVLRPGSLDDAGVARVLGAARCWPTECQ